MALTNFRVLGGEDEFNGAVAIRCDDAKQPVLALVERALLDDYLTLRTPAKQLTLVERRSIVETNLPAFAPLIQAKYSAGEYSQHQRPGALVPMVRISALPQLKP
jgi:hypothetical protein